MFRHAGVYVTVLIAVLLGVAALWAQDQDVTCPAPSTPEMTAAQDEVPSDAASDDEKAVSGEEEPVEAAETFTVEATRLKIEVPLDGVFEADDMFPVSVVPEAWSNMEVLRAVPSGTQVTAGEQILWLDTEEIDRQIANAEAGEKLADLQLNVAEHELAFLQQSTDRDLLWARRAARIREEDHERWLVLTEGYRDQYLALDEEGIHLRHEASTEELRQLKEMYEADELIEDTETMILKRNEYYAKRSDVDYEVEQKNFQYRLDLDIPRDREEHARAMEDSRIALEKTEIMLPLQLAIKQQQVTKAQRDRQEARENLQKLKADRELMTVTAPADGVVYYGECVRGQWVSGGAMESKLKEGGKIGSREVFMTIVKPDALIVRADIDEGSLYEITAGRKVTVTPTGFPEEKLTGQVDEVIIAPSLSAKYSITVQLDSTISPVIPGMTCKLKVLVVDKPDALVVPTSAVRSEEDEPDQKYVYLYVPDGEPEKRAVEVGRTKDGSIEILQGLSVGDKILTENPTKAEGAE